ncbi:chemotaxis protein [Oceanimonas sp. CAM02]|uniref:chemotaxis protein n=1 Tax=Oceanimonas sp. CAM02 TaxID=3080336 RepID=UPI0029354110|nr:chemotaxis protein [Oceanimonas sp. CAM02]MDV2856775.1 chemotaxis protein [Oceanimonas sp. CAM02]
MQQKTASVAMLFVVSILLLSGLMSLSLLWTSQKSIEDTQERRFEYLETAAQMSILSGQLSARIRNYVYTGSEHALSMYHHTLAVVEGRTVRESGRLESDDQRINSMMLTTEEREALERARQATSTLFRLEEEALRLMATGSVHQARLKVFNTDYDRYSKLVSDSVSQFSRLVLDRTSLEVERKQAFNTQILMFIMFAILLLVSITLLLLLQNIRQSRSRVTASMPGVKAGS